ncbi:MAG: nucleotidyltransferase family protein [Clostridia bacterium]|nr:nucleotidyltransferase family protein [Clostridia bacterium]
MDKSLRLLLGLLCYAMEWQTRAPLRSDAAELSAVWQLAERQNITPLIAYAAQQAGMLSGEDSLGQQPLLALYRYEQQQYVLNEVAAALTAARIPYMPLKGAVLQQWYPQPWMRVGCDIDVLVPSERLEEAAAALAALPGYVRGRQGAHDVSFFSPAQVHIELHHRLVEEGRAGAAASILSAVWEQAQPATEDSCRYEMGDSLFYFYHVAHMAKHMEAGGCGLRFFLDLWVLEQQPHCQEERDAMLKAGGLLPFADACRGLAAFWFGQGQANDTVRMLESFVLRGGVYGSIANQTAAARNRQGGKAGYIVGRLFPSYETLQWDFPILRKCRLLLPLFWIWRLLRLPFGGRLSRATRQMSAAEGGNDVSTLFQKLHLH